MPGTYTVVAVRDGDPAASNGAGKTRLLRAIYYALYGAVPGRTLPELVSWDEQEMSVELDLSCGLKIKRGVTRGAGWVDVTGAEGARTGDANARILAAVGSSAKDALATSFLGAGDVGELAGSEPAKRRDLVARWVVPDLWPEFRAKAGDVVKQLERALAVEAGKLAALRASPVDLGALSRLVHEKRGEVEELQEQLKACPPAPNLVDVGKVVGVKERWRTRLRAQGEFDRALEELAPGPASDALAASQAARDAARDSARAASNRMVELAALAGGSFAGPCPVDQAACPRADEIRGNVELHRINHHRARNENDALQVERRRTEEAALALTTQARQAAQAAAAVARIEDSLASPQVTLLGAAARALKPADGRSQELARALRTAGEELTRADERFNRAMRDAGVEKEVAVRVAELERRLAGLRWFEAACGRDGVPAMIVERSVGAIAADANAVLAGSRLQVAFRTRVESSRKADRCPSCSRAFGPREKACPCGVPRGMQVDPDMSVMVRRGTDRPSELAQRSSGETMVCAVGLRVGAAAWRRRNAGVAWSVLVLDEAEGPLDAANRAGFADVVHRSASSIGFDQTFFVSHGTNQAAGQRVIRIVGEGPWSRLEVQ